MTKEKLFKLFLKGKYSFIEIAGMSGEKETAVRTFYYTNKKKLPKPPRSKNRRITPVHKMRFKRKSTITKNLDKAYALYLKGTSLKELGDKYGGVTSQYISQVFGKHGLQARKSGAQRKFFKCAKGHKLGQDEYYNKCSTCKEERRIFREKGLHLKTECKWGHALTPDNLIVNRDAKGRDYRRCKKCMYKRCLEYQRRKRSESHNA